MVGTILAILLVIMTTKTKLTKAQLAKTAALPAVTEVQATYSRRDYVNLAMVAHEARMRQPLVTIADYRDGLARTRTDLPSLSDD